MMSMSCHSSTFIFDALVAITTVPSDFRPISSMRKRTANPGLLPSSMHCAAASERSISNPRPWAFWNGRQWNDSRKSSPASGMTGMRGKGRSFLTCHSMTKWCFSSSRLKRLDLHFLLIFQWEPSNRTALYSERSQSKTGRFSHLLSWGREKKKHVIVRKGLHDHRTNQKAENHKHFL